MTIDQLVEEYVGYKKSLGMLFHTPTVRLKAFAAAVGHVDVAKITSEDVRLFLYNVRPVTSYWFSKASAIGSLFRYARARGYIAVDLMPTQLPPGQMRKFIPYIYSIEDMQRMLGVIDGRHRGSWHMEPYTARVLLLLLYATGLRISEALRLRHADVDLTAAVLTVRETKFFKSRLVPIGPDLAGVVQEYFRRKWIETKRTRTPESPFLATYDFRPVTRQTAELTFQRVRAEAGVKRTDGARYQPRIHDFRHTFAVTRLVSWYREGKDVQRLLPHLSTYLGHVSVKDTSRYLSMTVELLQEANARFERYALTGGVQ
jgi:integrase/recombinase XerD